MQCVLLSSCIVTFPGLPPQTQHDMQKIAKHLSDFYCVFLLRCVCRGRPGNEASLAVYIHVYMYMYTVCTCMCYYICI